MLVEFCSCNIEFPQQLNFAQHFHNSSTREGGHGSPAWAFAEMGVPKGDRHQCFLTCWCRIFFIRLVSSAALCTLQLLGRHGECAPTVGISVHLRGARGLNGIGDEGAKSLAEALRGNFCTVTALNLSHNDIRDSRRGERARRSRPLGAPSPTWT
ncbi:unnamed protein product [Prorocentrum cordatum]|uniref:Uncharacterized protein n=1 Tax=Prorocentrum cordatum TaxID=2364126 RepID=A0ABN9X011_9DINO|nr:unnamed protein product [Polarella glacialis]